MGRPRKEQQKEKTNKEKEVEEIEESVIEVDDEEDNGVVEFVSTGSDILNLISSGKTGGGFPWGKIINIVGDASTGKTLLASEFIYSAYKIFGNELEWHYDDAEAGYSFDSKKIWGIDILQDDDDCSETLEDFHLNVKKRLSKLKAGKRLIYVLDSFDSLTSIEEEKYVEAKLKEAEREREGKGDDEKKKGTYGTSKSKGAHQFFRDLRREIKNKNAIILVVSQVKENIGATLFQPRYIRTGGKSLDFYPALVCWLAVAEKHWVGDRCSGVTIRVFNTKNKVWKPFREGFVKILFDYGVDNIESNILFLYDLVTDTGKQVKKINSIELDWDGETFSLRKLIRHIEKNNLEKELSKRVQEKWNALEEKANTAIGRKPK